MSLSIRAAALAAATLVAVPSVAGAACRQSDLRGEWLVLVFGGSCDVRVGGDGSFKDEPCYDLLGRKTSTLTADLSIDGACRITGTGVWKEGRRRSPLTIRARMNRSDDLFSGTARKGSDRVSFVAYAQ